MKQIVVITPADARYGFRLTGVRQIDVSSGELHKTLLELVADPAVGVLLIDERLIDAGARRRLRELDRLWTGLAVILPGPRKAVRPADDYILSLIRRAVGYQVRLNL